MKTNWPYPHKPQHPDDPVLGGSAPRFERHIYIFRSQIIYDLEAQATIIMKARKTDDGKENADIANNISTMRPLVNRWIDKYLQLAKARMAAFVLDRFQQSRSDNIQNEDEIDITLLVPIEYDDTTFQPLVQAVHDYIQGGVLYEYLVIALSPKDPVTENKRLELDNAYHDIKRYVCSVKPGTVKKRFYPFV